jgi:cardiolipin synthase
VVSLNTLPVVALPMYWIFGRSKFKGYVIARRAEDLELRDELASASANAQAHLAVIGTDKGRVLAAERLAKLPAVGGNQVKLLVDGQATFASILEGIASARDYVVVQFYLVRADAIGTELKDALMTKATEGVRVLFLYDEIGSYGLSSAYV